MKKVVLSIIAAFAIMGCVYKAPLAAPQDIAVDNSVLGAWNIIDQTAAEGKITDKLLVLKYDKNEYLVNYENNDGSMYFRGYPINVNDNLYIQLQLIGTDKGSVKEQDRKYQVIAYSLNKDTLNISLLNAELLKPQDINTTEEFVKAFNESKNNEKLFSEPVAFNRVK